MSTVAPSGGVVYRVTLRTFRDGDGDGIGDLTGARLGLEHLAWLGVDAVWLDGDGAPQATEAAAWASLTSAALARGLTIAADPTTARTTDGSADRLEVLDLPWEASAWSAHLARIADEERADGTPRTWALAAPGRPRPVTSLRSEARARVAATLLLGLRGTAVLRAGDELGLEDATDGGGSADVLLPWTADDRGGWTARSGASDLAPPPDAAGRSIAAERRDAASILHLHRRLITARRWGPALRTGAQEVLDLGPGLVVVRRHGGGTEERLIVACLADEPLAVPLERRWRVTIASDDPTAAGPFDGRLAPARAVVLAPAV